MPNFMRPGIPDLTGLVDEAADSALLGGTELPPAAAGLQPVADLLASLRAAPTWDELAGEARVLAMFRARGGVAAQPVPAHRRPRRVLAIRLAPKAAVAAVVTAFSLGGVALGAYAGALPSPIQRLAHDMIGAPDAPPARLSPDPGPGMPLGPGRGRDGRASHSPSAHPSPRHSRPRPSSPGNGQPGVHSSPPTQPTPRPRPSHRTPPAHPTPSHPGPSPHPSHSAHPSHAPHTAQALPAQPPQAQPLPGF